MKAAAFTKLTCRVSIWGSCSHLFKGAFTPRHMHRERSKKVFTVEILKTVIYFGLNYPLFPPAVFTEQDRYWIRSVCTERPVFVESREAVPCGRAFAEQDKVLIIDAPLKKVVQIPWKFVHILISQVVVDVLPQPLGASSHWRRIIKIKARTHLGRWKLSLNRIKPSKHSDPRSLPRGTAILSRPTLAADWVEFAKKVGRARKKLSCAHFFARSPRPA